LKIRIECQFDNKKLKKNLLSSTDVVPLQTVAIEITSRLIIVI